MPAILHDKDWTGIASKLLDSLSGEGNADWAENVATSIACHGAVRAGQILNKDEMRELVRQLEQTANPRTCPHGRPTMIHVSSEQLMKEFGRS